MMKLCLSIFKNPIVREIDIMANTFKEVKKFMETADVTMVGLHYMDENYPKRMTHIYDSKRECNVHLEMSEDVNTHSIIGKLYFIDDDEVYMIRVKNGVADYNNPFSISMNTNVTDREFRLACSHAFGSYAPFMFNVIGDMASIGANL